MIARRASGIVATGNVVVFSFYRVAVAVYIAYGEFGRNLTCLLQYQIAYGERVW